MAREERPEAARKATKARWAKRRQQEEPSWQVQASVAACGFGAWLNFSGSHGSTYCRAY